MVNQKPVAKRTNAKVRAVADIWPSLANDVAVKPIIDDPVSPGTRMDNTTELAVRQRAIDDKRRLQVDADMPGGPGTFEPSGSKTKFR